MKKLTCYSKAKFNCFYRWVCNQYKTSKTRFLIGTLFVVLVFWMLIGARLLYFTVTWSFPCGNDTNFIRFVSYGAGGIIALFGILIATYRANQNDKQIKQTELQIKNSQLQAENSRLDNRFKDAVTLLANDSRTVRIGALNILFEISKSESQRMIEDESYQSNYPTIVVETICGFIREQSNQDYENNLEYKDFVTEVIELKKDKGRLEGSATLKIMVDNNEFETSSDIQKALDILFKHPSYNNLTEDVRDRKIREYFESVFKGVKRIEFNLTNSVLPGCNLISAYLNGINMQGAQLFKAQLGGSDLRNIILGGSFFVSVYSLGARFKRAFLERAIIDQSDFKGAFLPEEYRTYK